MPPQTFINYHLFSSRIANSMTNLNELEFNCDLKPRRSPKNLHYFAHTNLDLAKATTMHYLLLKSKHRM